MILFLFYNCEKKLVAYLDLEGPILNDLCAYSWFSDQVSSLRMVELVAVEILEDLRQVLSGTSMTNSSNLKLFCFQTKFYLCTNCSINEFIVMI